MKLKNDNILGLVAARSHAYITLKRAIALEECAEEPWQIRSKDRGGNGWLRQSMLLRALISSREVACADGDSAQPERMPPRRTQS